MEINSNGGRIKQKLVAASKPKKDNYKISGYIKFLDKDGYTSS
jgi:hypothetical protein